MTDREIAVAVNADQNYIMPLAVMVRSLMDNLNKNTHVNLYVMEHSIPAAKKEKFEKSFNDLNCISIKWLESDRAVFKNAKVSKEMPLATYFRLVLGRVLPLQLQRVIYLDCDIIVNEDITGLWEIDLKDGVVGAVKDAIITECPQYLFRLQQKPYEGGVGYFNSGVLLINLDRWRERHMSDLFLSFMDKGMSLITYYEQDIMNAILMGNWLALDERWNQQTPARRDPQRDDNYRRMIQAPRLIHFSGVGLKNKPWHYSNGHPLKSLFYYYLNKTMWRGWRPKLISGMLYDLLAAAKEFRRRRANGRKKRERVNG